MFCHNCGREVSTKFCPHCGTAVPQIPDLSTPAPEKYEGTLGYLLLDGDSVTVHKKILMRTTEHRIAYTDIVGVTFEASKGLGTGYLSLRSRKNAHLPPVDSYHAPSDETTLCFNVYQSAQFHSIYLTLKPFADRNAACQPERPAPESDAAHNPARSQEVPDLEPYFQSHYPSRMRAIKALHRDTGIAFSTCKDLVESYFSANLARVPMRRSKSAAVPVVTKADRKKQLKASGQVYCPKCLSTSVAAQEKGFSTGKAVIGAALIGGIGLLAGNLGSKKLRCVCLNCGHKWKP